MATFNPSEGRSFPEFERNGRDLLSTLPPELLLAIFEEHQDIVPPSATPVCHALLPYLRLNAYRSLRLPDDIALAALGETLRTSPHLGTFIREIEAVERVKGGQEHTAWLMGSFIAAFDGLPVVETISIRRGDLSEILDPRILQTTAFRSATTLKLASPEPIPHPALRYLHLSTSLDTLLIASPMRYAPGRPTGVFAGNLSGIRKLAITAEPHSADFGAFFEYCQLEELELRSGTANLERIVQSIGPNTRSNLTSLYFSSTAFLSHRIDHALLAFPSLVDLTLWAIQFELTPEFFTTLAPLPLRSVTFLGPSDRVVADIGEWMSSDLRPSSLADLAVDMDIPSRSPSPALERTIDAESWRSGRDAKSLEGACARCGVSLRGSIIKALQAMREG